MLQIVIPLTAIISFIISQRQRFFFQDDWVHLSQVFNKKFIEVAAYFNLFQQNQLDRANFFRPLSTRLYFWLSYKLFGLWPLGYFLVNSLLFLAISYLMFIFLQKLLSKKQAIWALFFYCFSLAHFTYFSHITLAEVLWLGVFSWLAILSWLNQKRFWAGIWLLLALMTRESALIIPIWILIYELWWKKRKFSKTFKKTAWLWLITGVYVVARSFIYGWPEDKGVYALAWGKHTLSNLFKYGQWNLNLVGWLNKMTPLSVIGWLGILILACLGLKSLLDLKKESKDIRRLIWGVGWWLIWLLPVMFFKSHRDPWNLILAAGGMALILGVVVAKMKPKQQYVFAGIYLLIFLTGLNYYSQNHWTVLRSRLSQDNYLTVQGQCDEEFIRLKEEKPKELQYALYYDLGPKVICNKDVKVIYE
jgi:hypothetical protein